MGAIIEAKHIFVMVSIPLGWKSASIVEVGMVELPVSMEVGDKRVDHRF